MELKKGVKVKGIQPEILLGAMIAKSCFNDHGYQFILTAVTDGQHMEGSKHYIGQAIDIRTRHIPEDYRKTVTDDLKRRLTVDYDVVVHSTHCHLEYDPK